MPRVELRGYRPGDESAIVETFNLVFGATDPDFVPRTMEVWRWINELNPSGQRIRLAVAEDGRLAAHVAGIAQRILFRGEPAFVNQSVDGFSHPDWRRALKRPGIYAETLNDFNRTYAGPPPHGDIFVWGLPILNAWRIGQAFCHERLIRTQNKLVLEPTAAGSEGRSERAAAAVDVEELIALPHDVDEFFARAARPYGIIAVRDKAQLDWRYSEHPLHDYSIAVARSQGRLVGYAIYRAGAYDGESGGLVCDWLIDPESPHVGHALRDWLTDKARGDGEPLVAVMADTNPDWLAFQRAGFRVRPTSYFPTAYLFGKQLSASDLHHDWYYTLGDSDLC